MTDCYDISKFKDKHKGVHRSGLLDSAKMPELLPSEEPEQKQLITKVTPKRGL